MVSGLAPSPRRPPTWTSLRSQAVTVTSPLTLLMLTWACAVAGWLQVERRIGQGEPGVQQGGEREGSVGFSWDSPDASAGVLAKPAQPRLLLFGAVEKALQRRRIRRLLDRLAQLHLRRGEFDRRAGQSRVVRLPGDARRQARAGAPSSRPTAWPGPRPARSRRRGWRRATTRVRAAGQRGCARWDGWRAAAASSARSMSAQRSRCGDCGWRRSRSWRRHSNSFMRVLPETCAAGRVPDAVVPWRCRPPCPVPG